MRRLSLLAALFTLSFTLVARANGPSLQPTDQLAICGDSITEQKLYSVYIEDYLLMCRPVPGVRAFQFGWSGETSWRFYDRLSNDVLRFHPTAATLCYGMNDGGYKDLTPAVTDQYRKAQTAIIDAMKKSGVHFIVLGSPGPVDSGTYKPRKPGDTEAAAYNTTLTALAEVDRQIATDESVTFADVNAIMNDVMAKAKAKYGKDYPVAGAKDGIHPDPNGHIVMAYAFLKGLGFNGDIGTITIDLAAQKADATDGHKILSYSGGVAEVESSRYPFCFYGDESNPTDPKNTKTILQFLPFNQDLNRFNLVVTGGIGKYKVTWGEKSELFDAAELAKGINLANEFLDNPFSEPFKKAQDAIAIQQGYETPMTKTFIHGLLAMKPDQRELFDSMVDALTQKNNALTDAAAAAVTPVRHTIKVEAAQ